MTELSAHLVDSVIPIVPVRQWVLTLPHVLRLADRLVASPETAPLLRSLGHDVVEVAMPELARAEAGLTCMSVLLSGPQSGTPAL